MQGPGRPRRRCVDTPDLPFAVVPGVSNNGFTRMVLTGGRTLLGYARQDDAFSLVVMDLHE